MSIMLCLGFISPESLFFSLFCASLCIQFFLVFYIDCGCFPVLWSICARMRGNNVGLLMSYAGDYKALIMCFVCSCAFHSLLQTGPDREGHSSSAAHALIYACCDGNDDGLVCSSDNQESIQFPCGFLH